MSIVFVIILSSSVFLLSLNTILILIDFLSLYSSNALSNIYISNNSILSKIVPACFFTILLIVSYSIFLSTTIDRSLVTFGYFGSSLYLEFFDIYFNTSVRLISEIYVSSVTPKLFKICFFTFPKSSYFLISNHIINCLSCMKYWILFFFLNNIFFYSYFF